MKTADQISAQKLRGGFYSSPNLVEVCLDRINELLPGATQLAVLEPTAGDGAFIRGLCCHELGRRVASLSAVELVGSEAALCREAIRNASFDGTVRIGSFLSREILFSPESFDVALGNPPFLRFQFVSAEDRRNIDLLAQQLGIAFKGVSNLWIPIFLGTLAKLRPGGAFAFVVPSECLTGISGRVVRNWLVRRSQHIQIDIFPVGSFSGVLQEVVILSGQVTADVRCEAKVSVFDHATQSSWAHVAHESITTWTGLLLTPKQLTAIEDVKQFVEVCSLGEVARIGVATVTGANEFFSLDDETRLKFGLDQWSRPLLARIRHASGLEFTPNDFELNRKTGMPVWLFDASSSESDPAVFRDPSQYLSLGEADDLHTRYKCRIRSPWYKVPVVRPGSLMLSKRSHHFPRLVRNAAEAVTTDTIYQGSTIGPYKGRERDLVGSFHNSLTLISAELFGRSFGGGVLELVPSEVKALLVPLVSVTDREFQRLDQLVRSEGAESSTLIEETDALVLRHIPRFTTDLLWTIQDARASLLRRRLDRN